MLFSQYILSRLNILDAATKGFGRQIQERTLFDQLLEVTDDSAEAVQLIKWGLATRFLLARGSSLSGGFCIDRAVIAPWRSKSNGESTDFNTAVAASWITNRSGQIKKS